MYAFFYPRITPNEPEHLDKTSPLRIPIRINVHLQLSDVGLKAIRTKKDRIQRIGPIDEMEI
jgi:hypothetical protein